MTEIDEKELELLNKLENMCRNVVFGEDGGAWYDLASDVAEILTQLDEVREN